MVLHLGVCQGQKSANIVVWTGFIFSVPSPVLRVWRSLLASCLLSLDNVYYAGYYLIAVITEPSLAAVAIPGGGGGALGYFLGGYLPPGTPNWHPVLKKNSPKIDTPF